MKGGESCIDIIKPYYAEDKSVDFNKLKGPFVISSTLLYNSDLLKLCFNSKNFEKVEIVDKLKVAPVNGSRAIYRFVGEKINARIAYDLSSLDMLCYDASVIASDNSPEAILEGH